MARVIEQQAMVVHLAVDKVRVRVGATSGCSSCESGQGCGGGIFARLVPKKPVVLTILTNSDSPIVKVGQKVLLGLPETFFLRWIALLFGVPLLAGLLAAAATQTLVSSQLFGFSALQIDALVLFSMVVISGAVFALISSGNRSRVAELDQLVLLKALSGNCQE